MRRAIAILIVVVGVSTVAWSAEAQSKVDSIVSSIMPINWNFNFDCLVKKGPGEYSNVPYTWAGEIYGIGYNYAHSYDGITNSGDTTFSILSGFDPDSGYVAGNWETGWKLTFTLDTVVHRISLAYKEVDNYRQEFGNFWFTGGYQISGSRIQAVTADTMLNSANWAGPTGQGYSEYVTPRGGWVTIGGASPPSDVSEMRPVSVPSFTSRILSDYVTRFSFPSTADGRIIRIFDLIGRERDEIRIAPQAQSIEYNTSRLSAGMYIATINGRTTKFTVP